MSGYADMQKDAEQTAWIKKWVPEDDPILADRSPEMFRFTLARARSAEAELKVYQDGVRDFQTLIRRATR